MQLIVFCPDVTESGTVDWALKNNYLYLPIISCFSLSLCLFNQMAEAPTEPAAKQSSNSTGFGMKAAITMLHGKFPKVKDMTTDTLEGLLQPKTDAEKKNVMLMVSDSAIFNCQVKRSTLFIYLFYFYTLYYPFRNLSVCPTPVYARITLIMHAC